MLMDVVRQQVTVFRQVLVILTGLLGGVGRVSISGVRGQGGSVGRRRV